MPATIMEKELPQCAGDKRSTSTKKAPETIIRTSNITLINTMSVSERLTKDALNKLINNGRMIATLINTCFSQGAVFP